MGATISRRARAILTGLVGGLLLVPHGSAAASDLVIVAADTSDPDDVQVVVRDDGAAAPTVVTVRHADGTTQEVKPTTLDARTAQIGVIVDTGSPLDDLKTRSATALHFLMAMKDVFDVPLPEVVVSGRGMDPAPSVGDLSQALDTLAALRPTSGSDLGPAIRATTELVRDAVRPVIVVLGDSAEHGPSDARDVVFVDDPHDDQGQLERLLGQLANERLIRFPAADPGGVTLQTAGGTAPLASRNDGAGDQPSTGIAGNQSTSGGARVGEPWFALAWPLGALGSMGLAVFAVMHLRRIRRPIRRSPALTPLGPDPGLSEPLVAAGPSASSTPAARIHRRSAGHAAVEPNEPGAQGASLVARPGGTEGGAASHDPRRATGRLVARGARWMPRSTPAALASRTVPILNRIRRSGLAWARRRASYFGRSFGGPGSMSSTMGLNAALSLFRAEGRLDFGRRHSRNSLGIYAAQDPERVAIEIAHATEAEPAGLVDLAHEVLSHERPARDLVDRAGRRARIATAIAAIQPVVVFVSATIASPAPSASTPQPGRFQALVAAATLTCVAMAWMLRLGRPPFVFLDRRAELTRLTVPAVLDRAALYATAGLSPQVAIRRAAADADSTPEVLIAAWRQGRAAPSPDVLLETASLLRARSEAVLKRRVQRLWQPMLVPYVLLVLPACWLLASILL